MEWVSCALSPESSHRLQPSKHMDQREFSEQYVALAHALQSGVAQEQALGSADGSPKHLRTGLNLVLRDHGSIVLLLVEKGVITAEEYHEAIIKGLKEEVSAYEERLTKHLGTKVTLH